MKSQAKAQDALPGTEVERHPMWTHETDESLPPHIYKLRRAIARSLTPFDGKPGAQADAMVVFCQSVYFLTTLPTAHDDPMWLLGRMAVVHHNMARPDMPAVQRNRFLFEAAVIENSRFP